jgi:hypothetical protein
MVHYEIMPFLIAILVVCLLALIGAITTLLLHRNLGEPIFLTFYYLLFSIVSVMCVTGAICGWFGVNELWKAIILGFVGTFGFVFSLYKIYKVWMH